MSENPPSDIDALASTMETQAATYEIRNTRIAFEKDFIEKGNWKLSIETTVNAITASANHPELCVTHRSSFWFRSRESERGGPGEWLLKAKPFTMNQTRKWEEPRLSLVRAGAISRQRDEFHEPQRLVLANGAESHTLDGRPPSERLLGSLKEKDLGERPPLGTQLLAPLLLRPRVISIVIPLSGPDTGQDEMAGAQGCGRTRTTTCKRAHRGLDRDHPAKTPNSSDEPMLGSPIRPYEQGLFCVHEGQLDNFATCTLIGCGPMV